MFGGKPIEIKSVDELALMRQAGLVVAKTLEKIRSEIAVGMTTADLMPLPERASTTMEQYHLSSGTTDFQP